MTASYFILVIFLLSHHPLRPINGECVGVQQCSCVTVDGKLTINCDSKQLTKVPTFASSPSFFSLLTLANNDIVEVRSNAFAGLNVEAIDLTGNKLKTISVQAFFGVESRLKKLLLELDSTAAFPIDPLRGLANLDSLHVQGFGGPALPEDCLKYIPQLKEFSVSYSAITGLSSSQVKNTRNIENLLLNDNQLRQIPSEALSTSLTGVRRLNLANNKIASISDADLRGAIEDLDLSGNTLGDSVNPNTFAQLGNHLKYLNLKSCSLGDSVLVALSKLPSLLILQLQSNNIGTLPADTFVKCNLLRTLNLADNKIAQLSGNSFNGLFNFLAVLRLERNANLRLQSLDVFSAFQSLKELYLDEITGLQFNSDSFRRSQNSLETLSLSRTNIGPSVFSVIKKIQSLKILNLDSTAISEIPNFAFNSNGRLQAVDLSGNSIANISQSTFVGLSNSLSRLNLNSNRISTLDECVFYRFKNIDFPSLGLRGNPLTCDCGLRWLHDGAKAQNPSQFNNLDWRCSDGKMFKEIDQSYLAGCPKMNVSCRSILPPTENKTSDIPLTLTVDEITADSALLRWSLQTGGVIYSFAITARMTDKNSSEISATVSRDLRHFRLTDLARSTGYVACVSADVSSDWRLERDRCVEFRTQSGSNSAMIGAVVGGIIGGLLLVSVLIGAVVCLRRKCRADDDDAVKTVATNSSATPTKNRQPTIGKTSYPASTSVAISNHITPTQFSGNQIDEILAALTAAQQNSSEFGNVKTMSSRLSGSRPSLRSDGGINEDASDVARHQPNNSYSDNNSHNDLCPPCEDKFERRRRRRGWSERSRASESAEVGSTSMNVPTLMTRNYYFENAVDTEV